MSVEITNAQDGDFQAVGELHRKGITEGFLSTLGAPFLAVLYRGIAAVANSGVIVAKQGGNVLGFIAYTANVKTCYKQVLKSKWPALAWAMLPNAFRLSMYREVVETLLYPFAAETTAKGRDNPAESAGKPRPELLSIAVAEGASGMGIGKRLVLALDDAVRLFGVDGYYVVTHAVDVRSNSFYSACGFQRMREFENHGKPMNEYYKTLA